MLCGKRIGCPAGSLGIIGNFAAAVFCTLAETWFVCVFLSKAKTEKNEKTLKALNKHQHFDRHTCLRAASQWSCHLRIYRIYSYICMHVHIAIWYTGKRCVDWYLLLNSSGKGQSPPTFNPTQAPQAIKLQSDGGAALDGWFKPTEM